MFGSMISKYDLALLFIIYVFFLVWVLFKVTSTAIFFTVAMAYGTNVSRTAKRVQP